MDAQREGPMTGSEYWMVWPANTAVSVLVVLLVAMAFLYAARKPVHHLIGSLGFLISGPLRIGARWLLAAANDMTQRNKAVLLAHGRQEVEQRIEREFERLGAMVTRDLQGYRPCSASFSTRSRASRRTTRNAGKCRRRRRNGW